MTNLGSAGGRMFVQASNGPLDLPVLSEMSTLLMQLFYALQNRVYLRHTCSHTWQHTLDESCFSFCFNICLNNYNKSCQLINQ